MAMAAANRGNEVTTDFDSLLETLASQAGTPLPNLPELVHRHRQPSERLGSVAHHSCRWASKRNGRQHAS